MTANRVQDFTGVPSRSTVQAPQLVVSHPMWVPVSPNVSRMKWTRRSRGSTSAVRSTPLTVTVICIVPPPQAARAISTARASPRRT
jgi:hypothetical protein